MATIKSYTDIQQSKKLAETLPLESADMEYLAIKENGKLVGSVPFVKDDSEVEDSAYSHTYDRIACWSLAALLGVIPNYKLNSEHNYHTCTSETNFGKESVGWYDNPIDACVAMIEKLHELKML